MIKLTEHDYDMLIKMFKEKLSYSTISSLLDIPIRIICREHKRWELCKAIYIVCHPAGELTIPINGKIFITDRGYEYLISLFKNEVPKRKISRLMNVPLNQIEKEYERWTLCQAIYQLSHQFRYPEVWNGGKRFGEAL